MQVVHVERTDMKPCIECHEVKPIDEFYEHKELKDGHLNVCKTCVKARTRRRDPQLVLETRLRMCEKNPSKYNANKAVAAAIETGALVRPTVCRCGSTKSIHAHHEDHAQPLRVEWLCPKCHAHHDSHKWEKVECERCGRTVSKNRLTVHSCA
jgi:hypothetical protein